MKGNVFQIMHSDLTVQQDELHASKLLLWTSYSSPNVTEINQGGWDGQNM